MPRTQKEGSGLFLFIDEFQVMSSDLMGTIIGLQHSMGQEDLPFYVIAAGLPNLPGVLTKSRSYAERLFQYKRIGRLPEDETRECFEKTIGKINVRFDDDALNRLIELSKGYPYFIQAYGSAAFDESESSPIPLSAVIKGEPIAQASLDSGLYESRWQRARPLEREYMRAMASLEKACAARRRSRNDWDGHLRMSYGSERHHRFRAGIFARTWALGIHRSRHG